MRIGKDIAQSWKSEARSSKMEESSSSRLQSGALRLSVPTGPCLAGRGVNPAGWGTIPTGKGKNLTGRGNNPAGTPKYLTGRLKMKQEIEKLSRIDKMFGRDARFKQLSSLRGDEERSVTIEQESNRIPDRFSLGATEMFGVPLLTIKYDNPASERIAETAKKAHLSASKTGGERNNKSWLTTKEIDTEERMLVACSSRPKNDECRLTIEDFRSDLTNRIGIETKYKTETTNKLVARSSKLTAQKINPYFLVLPGKRTVANKLIKQSCAYET